MTNILLNTTTFSFTNNSELYRYCRIQQSHLASDRTEQLLRLIAERDLVHQLENFVNNGLNIHQYHFEQGNTLLHTMAQYDAIECTRYLIKKGANINALSDYGSTPLENARAAGAKKTDAYLSDIGAKAHVTTLLDLLEASAIPAYDKKLLTMAIRYNEELTDIIQNLRAFTEQLLVLSMNQRAAEPLFLAGMRLLMQDHEEKLSTLLKTRTALSYSQLSQLLSQYDLTRQQAEIFRQLYLNQELLPRLQDITAHLAEHAEPSVNWLSETDRYLSNLLW